MEHLFTSMEEYTDFLNALAYRKTKISKSNNEIFESEISDILKKCDEFFNKYNTSNFISEILELETTMQGVETGKLGSIDLEELSLKRENLYKKYNQFLEKLSLDEKEDLEFLFKKVLNRETRLKQNEDLIRDIKENFPGVDSVTVESIKKQPIFKTINDYLNPNEESFDEIVETNNLPYVVQIKEAAKELVDVKTDDIDAVPEIDNSFYDPADNFTSVIEETESVEPVDSSNELVEEDEPLTYTMDKGDSLTKVALAICDNENGWEDIFDANELVLSHRLVEKGYTVKDKDRLKDNEEIYAGLELVIPNVFTHIIENSAQTGLAMAA